MREKDKMQKIMKKLAKFKGGTLKDRKQAIAIAFNESERKK